MFSVHFNLNRHTIKAGATRKYSKPSISELIQVLNKTGASGTQSLLYEVRDDKK